MWQYIILALFTIIFVYVIHILTQSDGSGYADTSIEAFIDYSSDSSTKPKPRKVSKYSRPYSELGRQVLILYATEYGFSQELSQLLFDRIEETAQKDSDSDNVIQPRLVNMKDFECVEFSKEQVVFIIISTAGNGVPPTDARPFFKSFQSLDTALTDLSALHFSVLALGDSNYPHFCRAGRELERRFESLGGKILAPRQDVDQEDWHAIKQWMDGVISTLSTISIETRLDYIVLPTGGHEEGYNRNQPFMATLKVKYNLTRGEKETIHCEFDLNGSGLTWTSGDALAIIPENNPEDVEELLNAWGVKGEEPVAMPTWAYQPITDENINLRTALIKYYDLHVIKPELLLMLANRVKNNTHLKSLVQGGTSKSNSKLHDYIHGHFVADMFEDFEIKKELISPSDVLVHMKALQPRYYSISSSPLVDPTTTCVTAAIVRYVNKGKKRGGVATTFLQDRLQIGQSCPVFISQNPEFRLPENGDVPVILIGPGTGIAPFRAFIQERVATGAGGLIRLYFGCQHKDGDFLYKEELESWQSEGRMHLRTAFSRDQPHKIYVQDLLREDGDLLYSLLTSPSPDEELIVPSTDKKLTSPSQNEKLNAPLPAHIYVCGDARHMAKDVHQALCHVISQRGHVTLEQAEHQLREMEREGRYQKDVWVA